MAARKKRTAGTDLSQPSSGPPRVQVERALLRFVAWLDRVGPTSQDHLDLWCWAPGRLAKRLYHRHPKLGFAAVGPLALLDTFAPATRRLVQRPTRFPIADAHYALGFLELEAATSVAAHGDRAARYLASLSASRSPGLVEWCWGYPVAWETRVGHWEATRPLITQTPYGYEAFVAAHDRWGDRRALTIAHSVVEFAARRIPTTRLTPEIEACAYTPFDNRRVVNANAYRAFLLVDGGARFQREDWIAAGTRNARFVLSAQSEDGSWPYATDGFDGFVDNFHTCFVLKNLVKIWRRTSDPDVLAAIGRGYAYYRRFLLDDDDEPLPFSVQQRLSLHRRELYDYAEGLNLALLMRSLDETAERIATRLAWLLVTDWQLRDGHFVTRRHALGANRVPYHRWAQSQAFHALTSYLSSLT